MGGLTLLFTGNRTPVVTSQGGIRLLSRPQKSIQVVKVETTRSESVACQLRYSRGVMPRRTLRLKQFFTAFVALSGHKLYCTRGYQVIMGTMLAAVLDDVRSLNVRQVAIPSIADGEALIRVKACGICQTDYKAFTGETHEWSPPDCSWS